MSSYIMQKENVLFTKEPLDQMIPFWLSNVMYNESVCFIKDAAGTLGRLMFKPEHIVCLRDNSLEREYVRGTDWDWDAQRCCLYLPKGSAIPYFERSELSGEGIKRFEEEPVGFDHTGRARIGNAIYCENEWHYGKTLYITYIADPTDTIQFPLRNAFIPSQLPKTMQKLRNGEPLKLVFFGDSTHTGADTSSWYKRQPFCPGYTVLFCQMLEKIYGSKITMVNHAVGGKDSVWGREEFSRCVLAEKPDLLLLGFGNNDQNYADGLARTVDNLQYMLSTAMEQLDCECVQLGPSTNNPNSGFMDNAYLLCAPFRSMQRTGLRYCNFFEMGLDLLARKDALCISGNGIAHPNDWTTKIYALNLLSLFVDWEDAAVSKAITGR